MDSKPSPNLDILRSFAVLTVMIDHLVPTIERYCGHVNPWILSFTAYIGDTGVLAFFVHTSLVLMQSLERLASAAPGQSISGRFYLRRFFRIYPLSIACVTAAVLLGIPAMTWRATPPITTEVVVANLLLIQNIFTKQSVIGPLWSLPYEVQMYLVLPALYYVSIRPHAVRNLCLLFAGACATGFMVAIATHRHLNVFAYIPCFLAGVLCYTLRHRQRPQLSAKLWPWVIFGLICIYCQWRLWAGVDEPAFWVKWLFCAALGLLINSFRDSTSHIGNLLAGRMAMYSYGVYLLHVPVLYLIFDIWHWRDALQICIAYFALTIIVSIPVYHFFEKPMIDVGRWLSQRPGRSPRGTQDLPVTIAAGE
jgi:peptidoglycan/LPS O-acetylase OafA/YrhL